MAAYDLEDGSGFYDLEDGSGAYELEGVSSTTITGTQASETDLARAGTVTRGAVLVGGLASEVDEARAGSVSVGSGALTITGGQALEVDEALTGSLSAGGGPVTVIGGQATETDEARAGSVSTPTVVGSYSGEVLADSPLAYYRMGETPGSTGMLDSSGNTHNGVYYGPELGVPGLVAGDTDTAAYFNFTSAATAGSWLEGMSAALTLEARIRADVTTGRTYGITQFWAGNLGTGWSLSIDGGRLRFGVWTGYEDEQVATGTTDLAPGVEYGIAATFDGTDLKVYVDGVLDGTTTVPGGGPLPVWFPSDEDVALYPVQIGAIDPGGTAFEGVIDEVAYYGTALTSTRLAAHQAAAGTNGVAHETDQARPGVILYSYTLTDTRNRVGGRRRGGYAVATWEPAVVDPPASVVYGEARDVAHAYGPVTMNGTQPVFDVDTASRTRHRTRIVVGGKDVTFFRGVPTPAPAYQLVSPLLYGPATLRLPQVAAAFEQLGTGDLGWLRTEQRVLVQRVDEAGDVVATDYRGVIVAFDTAGADLTVEIGGEASGRAALMERQPPIFRTVNDIGAHAYYAIRALGLPFTPRLGPDTGISLARFGGTGHLDYISQLCARAWTQSGNQWTIMPSTDTGAYRMVRKDTTTIDATAYLDDAYTVGSLRRDLAEEPNRLYATGVTPEGQRVRFGAYPGLKQGTAAPYPFNDDRNFGLGTTNADTHTGDGITVMIDKLRVHKYMDAIDQPGGYDADAAAGVRQLQNDAGLTVTGTMTLATWRALFDLDATGFSLRQSQIMPAAQKTYTKQWHRSGAGAQLRKNPNYDKRRLKRDRTVDLGSGFTVEQMREFARAEIDASNDDNWVGQITFHTGALVAGDHVPGTPVAPSDIFRARALRPGMNLALPLFDGGIVVHVSAVSVGEDGTVTATVDTRARDSMAVWEVIQRNRESRRNPARQWVRDHRASGEIKDAIDGWDEVGGLLGDNVTIPGHRWTIFEVVAGQEGTVARLRLRTNPNAEFVCAVFGRVFDTDAMEKRLTRRVGNPLTEAGSKKWEDEDVRDDLDENNFLLYVAGSNEDPCGYYPKHKTDGETTNPLTGRWKDDAGFSYRTFAQPVLYVAMYTDRDTVVPTGPLMWPQLEAGA